jgi:hypothetical protein
MVKSIKEFWEENPWKVFTIIFVCIALLAVANILYTDYEEKNNMNDKYCSVISATPAWFSSDDKLISYGVIPLSENESTIENAKVLVDFLISSNIKFIYSSDCSACHNQISLFGENNWKRYVESGLTIDCKNK